jgi:ATP-dependent RNA helicase RhlE
MQFSDLGLSTDILRALKDEGYTEPTPIQQQAIPAVLAGRDVFASAQTGTGKTAGFTLPMLQLLGALHKVQRVPRALILTPTRELAAQIGDSVKTYGKNLSLRSTVVYGGVGIVPQIQALRRGVDIVIATPGRLLDHLGQRTLDLSHIEILVLDECDRMLDMGFIHDIRKVMSALPKARQTLMFSATFSKPIQQLANTLLNDPTLIEVAPRNTAAERVEQVVHLVDRDRKRALLAYMISFHNWKQVLVFTRTKHGANRLAEQLTQDGLKSAAIHGNKSQAARTRALNDFKVGKVRVLVATDVASRGIDIDQLPHVVNYELPNVPEDYVHRIGRTGRAGNGGKAVSLVCGEEKPLLKDIEQLLNQNLARVLVPGYEPKGGEVVSAPEPKGRVRDTREGSRQGARPNSGNAQGQPKSSKPHDPPTRSKKPVSASRARKRLRSAGSS